ELFAGRLGPRPGEQLPDIGVQRVGVYRLAFLRCALAFGVIEVVPPLRYDVRRRAEVDYIAAAEIEAQRTAYHDHHHGGDDADVGQAGGVALHAVEHPRDAYKVVGPVVIPPVGPQRLQHGYGHRGEEAVGAYHHQEHGDEVERDGHGPV